MTKMGKAKLIKEDPNKIIIQFGKHAGEYLGDIPEDYLSWLISQNDFETNRPRLAKQIKQILNENKKESSQYSSYDPCDNYDDYDDDDIPF